MTRDPRFDAATATNDGAGRGWDFRRDVPTSYGIIRNLPALFIAAIAIASVCAIIIMAF